MDVLVPYKARAAKIIKLDHSYATHMTDFELVEVKEEDPLKIYPEDLRSIKTEVDEEIAAIKTEPDTTDCHIPARLNLDDKNEVKDSSVLLVRSESANKDRDGNFPCKDSLGLVNRGNEVANKTDLLTLVDDAVPRHVFLELQGMYERTVADLKALNSCKIETENSANKRSTGKSLRSGRNPVKYQKLTDQIKKLKDQLAVSKHNLDLQKKATESRTLEKVELKKINAKLEKRVQNLEQTVQDLKRQSTINENEVRTLKVNLKRQATSFNEKREQMEAATSSSQKRLAAKEIQHKECELKCSQLTQKLTSATLTLTQQAVELGKLKLDMDIMDKSIIDSLKTRQLFKEQAAKLEKELGSLKDDPVLTLKLQEAHTQLNDANGRLEQLQKVVATERKLTQSLVQEKAALVGVQKRKSSEADKRLASLNQHVTWLKTSLSQKVLQCDIMQDEATSLQALVKQKEEELEQKEMQLKAMEEEYKGKVCEYCGFEQ